MVVIHVKGDDAEEKKQFLYECFSSSSIEDITQSIVEIYNLQSKIQLLAVKLRDRLLSSSSSAPKGCPDTLISLQRALSEAETYASKEQVLNKRPLSPYVLEDHLRSLEKEAMASLCLDVTEYSTDSKLLDKESTQIWWAGKQLIRGKRLFNYIGGNERTKIVVSLKLDVSLANTILEPGIGNDLAPNKITKYTSVSTSKKKEIELEKGVHESPYDQESCRTEFFLFEVAELSRL